MRLILSRKGFDSSAGGLPSPVLPDGSMISLPIPAWGPKTFSDVRFNGRPLTELLSSLDGKRDFSVKRCHLDPDLREDALPRLPGWRAMFGTVGSAQGHLEKQGVAPGDLFLFFGWFREAEETRRGLRFKPEAPDEHVLFGWLQVGEIHQDMPRLLRNKPWTRDHPHVTGRWQANNTVYIAAEKLEFGSTPNGIAGAGVFPTYHPSLRLTAPGPSRCLWSLPGWFHPDGRASILTYHGDLARWQRSGDRVLLDAAKRGQEFVLNLDHYPEAVPWILSFFENNPWVASTSTR